MVHCVVTGCSNKSENPGVSFFQFPKFKKTWKSEKSKVNWDWIVKVNRAESRPSDKLWMPDKNSHVCSDHFEKHCFTRDPDISKSLGFKQLRLKDCVSVIPTLFPDVGHKKSSTPSPKDRPTQPRRSAFAKREHLRVLKEIFSNSQDESPQAAKESSVDFVDQAPACVAVDMVECAHGLDNCAVDLNNSTTTCTSPVREPIKTYVKRTQTEWTSTSQGTQSEPERAPIVLRSIGTMTDPIQGTGLPPDHHCSCCRSRSNIKETTDDDMDYEEEDEEMEEDSSDDDWLPDDDIPSDDEDIIMDDDLVDVDLTDVHMDDPVSQRKHIVFESCLKELLSVCRTCLAPCHVILRRQRGTMVVMDSICQGPDRHIFSWNSQPMLNRLPVGNILMSGAVLYSGCSVTDLIKMFNRANISCFSDRTYRYLQSFYLVPTLFKTWELSQQRLLQASMDTDLKMGGDARCCSPGHTAKYASYSLMDLQSGVILDTQLVQTTEVNNSNAMELEGLKRCLQTLKDNNLKVTDLTTDRHVQVRKYMRTEEPDINHWFDCWHVSKGVYRKLLTLSKKKGCELIGDWSHSISNHMYWAAATSNGDGDLVEQKWTSVANHVANVHEGHGDRYPACPHDVIPDDRKWMKLGSRAHKELKDVVLNGRLVKDIRKLSPMEQTSKLEAFHKVVCQFAPKFQHFFYDAMKARITVAVLHHNENVSRGHAKDKDGILKYRISYPKAKKGGHTVKKVKDDCTYGYVNELLKGTLERRNQFPSYKLARAAIERHQKPLCLSQTANRIDRQTAIQQHRSRFNVIVQ